MPDITMCSGQGCSQREKCYRHTATPTERQSYFAFPPMLEGVCGYFWASDYSKPQETTPPVRQEPPYPFCSHPEKCCATGRCERRVGGELHCCAD